MVFVRGADARAHLVYTDSESGELVSVSDDGTRGIFRRYVAPGNTVDVAVDLQSRRS